MDLSLCLRVCVCVCVWLYVYVCACACACMCVVGVEGGVRVHSRSFLHSFIRLRSCPSSSAGREAASQTTTRGTSLARCKTTSLTNGEDGGGRGRAGAGEKKVGWTLFPSFSTAPTCPGHALHLPRSPPFYHIGRQGCKMWVKDPSKSVVLEVRAKGIERPERGREVRGVREGRGEREARVRRG